MGSRLNLFLQIRRSLENLSSGWIDIAFELIVVNMRRLHCKKFKSHELAFKNASQQLQLPAVGLPRIEQDVRRYLELLNYLLSAGSIIRI